MIDMDDRPTRKREPLMPWWFKAWFAFCALLGLGLLGLIAWAVVALVTHFTD